MGALTRGQGLGDAELVAGLVRGDADALEALVRRYHGPLFAYACRLVRDAHMAQDLVQETFYRLCRHAGTLDRPEAVRTWLYRVLTRLAQDWARAAATRRERVEDAGAVTRAAEAGADGGRVVSLAELIERREDRRRVAEALARLPEEQRVVILLRFYQELSLAEIAGVLGIPVGTVKSRLHYGLKALHAVLVAGAGARARGGESS